MQQPGAAGFETAEMQSDLHQNEALPTPQIGPAGRSELVMVVSVMSVRGSSKVYRTCAAVSTGLSRIHNALSC